MSRRLFIFTNVSNIVTKALFFLCSTVFMSAGFAAAEDNPPQELTSKIQQADFKISSVQNFTDETSLKTFVREAGSEMKLVLPNLSKFVEDDYEYRGLAQYLGGSLLVKITPEGRVSKLKLKDKAATVSGENWAGFRGRFQSVLLRSSGAQMYFTSEGLEIVFSEREAATIDVIYGFQDSNETQITDVVDLKDLQYIQLPAWLRWIARGIEQLYKLIYDIAPLGWGFCLILLAVFIKLAMAPLTALTSRFQKEVNEHKSALEPIFDDIKKNYKGEEAHEKTMAAYKARKITPYYVLTPMLSTMIGLPILIAIFNMLGEVLPLKNSEFLWIDSLAYPDKIGTLPFSIPFFGNALNLLPFLMMLVTIVSTTSMNSPIANSREISKQKRNLYLMAITFFFIFYNFPSGMVLYWTVVVFLQLIFDKFITRSYDSNLA